MWRVFVSLALTIAATAPASSSKLRSCDAVKREIHAQGAQHVLDRMWADTDFSRLIPHVAAAEPCWLDVADLLKSVADAGASEELDGAMSQALTVHPERVIPHLSHGHRFEIDVVCGGSQVAVDDVSGAATQRWLKLARTAVQRAKLPPALEPTRQQCLAEIAKERRRERP